MEILTCLQMAILYSPNNTTSNEDIVVKVDANTVLMATIKKRIHLNLSD